MMKAQQQKVKARKVFRQKYGIGVVQSDSHSGNNSVTRLAPLEKADNELFMYLQYPQLEIDDCLLN